MRRRVDGNGFPNASHRVELVDALRAVQAADSLNRAECSRVCGLVACGTKSDVTISQVLTQVTNVLRLDAHDRLTRLACDGLRQATAITDALVCGNQ